MSEQQKNTNLPDRDKAVLEKKTSSSSHIDSSLLAKLELALKNCCRKEIDALLEPLHEADLIEVLTHLPPKNRVYIIKRLDDQKAGDVFALLQEPFCSDLFFTLSPARQTRIIRHLDSDDAVQLLGDFEHGKQDKILRAISLAERVFLEQGLSWPENSAGRLMRREIVAIPEYWTVGQVIDYFRYSKEKNIPDEFYSLAVVSPRFEPVGTVLLSKILRHERRTFVNQLMESSPRLIHATMDEEEVVRLFYKYGFVEAPVIDESGKLVGSITADDAAYVLDEKISGDLFNLAGVREDDLHQNILGTAFARSRWLLVNLMTALLASAAIGVFEPVLQQFIALAILLPITASMGGNAGTQTLAIAIQAMAKNQLSFRRNRLRLMVKELAVGFINGTAFALLAGMISAIWFSNPKLGVVTAVAMMVNLTIAGISGVLVPLGLKAIGADPAVGSSVILTTITDLTGFICFLGLAVIVLG